MSRSTDPSDIVAIAVARTAIGKFGGTLRNELVFDLGAAAIKGALDRSSMAATSVDKVIYANCRQAGNGINPARTAAIRGGVPISVPAFTINMACPSGIKAAMLAAQEILSGNSRFIITGGMESMSTMPYMLKGARWEGFRSGDRTLLDGWNDAVDPICGYGMGITAENQTAAYKISRADQDQFAFESQQKAATAQLAGWFDDEIVPYTIESDRSRKGEVFVKDEGWREDTTLEKLGKLPAAFKSDGSVTAGNACTMGDAACALILTSREIAYAEGLTPLFSIIGAAEAAVNPAFMGDGPSVSIPMALKSAGMHLDDMDAIEVNEAFAVQVLSNEKALRWDRSKLNQWGGAIALGHPTGFTGARLLVTLNSILKRSEKEFGVAAACGGGGVTAAMVIRREY